MVRAVSGVMPPIVPAPLCCREVSTRFPLWLLFLEKKKGPCGLRPPSHGVWDLPEPGTGTSSGHWPSFETGGAEVSCKRWEAGEGRRHGLCCALGGCGFGPGPALGELILQGSQEAAALWGDSGHCPGRAGGRRQPGSSVSRKLRQSPQHPLCAQKARLESPSGEDARLCGCVLLGC